MIQIHFWAGFFFVSPLFLFFGIIDEATTTMMQTRGKCGRKSSKCTFEGGTVEETLPGKKGKRNEGNSGVGGQ